MMPSGSHISTRQIRAILRFFISADLSWTEHITAAFNRTCPLFPHKFLIKTRWIQQLIVLHCFSNERAEMTFSCTEVESRRLQSITSWPSLLLCLSTGNTYMASPLLLAATTGSIRHFNHTDSASSTMSLTHITKPSDTNKATSAIFFYQFL